MELTLQSYQTKSPYFTLFDKESDIQNFKVFDCLAFASNLQSHRSKLELRDRKYSFKS